MRRVVPDPSRQGARLRAGTTVEDAVAASVRLAVSGLRSTLEFLTAEATDLARARANRDVHRRALHLLADAGLVGADAPSAAEVTVHLSDVGLRMGQDGQKVAVEHAHDICVAASEVGTSVLFDARNAAEVEATLAVLDELRPDFPSMGVGLPAGLRQAEDACRDLAGIGSRVRVCKGTPESGSADWFTTREEIDRSFARCLKVLMPGRCYPMLATYDRRLLRITESLATRYGRTPGSYEYQMLYGVRSREQLRRARRGDIVRVDVLFGDPWFTQVLHRLGERPMRSGSLVRMLGTWD